MKGKPLIEPLHCLLLLPFIL